MTAPRIGYLVIDTVDLDEAAAFWSALLEVDAAGRFGGDDFLLLRPTADGLRIAFQRVPEAKEVKNRLHLDLVVEDLEAATRRAQEFGATWDGQDRELDGYRWRCLADVQGNEFDLVLDD